MQISWSRYRCAYVLVFCFAVACELYELSSSCLDHVPSLSVCQSACLSAFLYLLNFINIELSSISVRIVFLLKLLILVVT